MPPMPMEIRLLLWSGLLLLWGIMVMELTQGVLWLWKQFTPSEPPDVQQIRNAINNAQLTTKAGNKCSF
jgi:hypothetical protein